MTGRQRIYAYLKVHGEKATSELANALEVSEALVSREARKLYQEGYLSRRRVNDRDDKHTTWTLWSIRT